MMLFGIYFPERSVLDRRMPWIKWLIALILAVSSLDAGVAGRYRNQLRWCAMDAFLSQVSAIRQVVGMAAISLFFANLGAKSGTASTKDVARRIRLVWLGAAAASLPPSYWRSSACSKAEVSEPESRHGQYMSHLAAWQSSP